MDSFSILMVLSGFIGGFVVACFMCIGASDSDDKKSEKSGIWRIEDRAYRLVKFDPAAQ